MVLAGGVRLIFKKPVVTTIYRFVTCIGLSAATGSFFMGNRGVIHILRALPLILVLSVEFVVFLMKTGPKP